MQEQQEYHGEIKISLKKSFINEISYINLYDIDFLKFSINNNYLHLNLSDDCYLSLKLNKFEMNDHIKSITMQGDKTIIYIHMYDKNGYNILKNKINNNINFQIQTLTH